MALYLIRLLFERTGGEPRDRVVWGFHVDSVVAPNLTDIQTAFAGAWTTAGMASILNGAYEADRIQVYDVSAGGPPVDEVLLPVDTFPTTGTGGPQEVQLCITRWTNDALGRPRKHGRWYVGPLSGFHMANNERPTQSLIDDLATFQQELHNGLEQQGVGEPVVVSRTSGLVTGYEIVQYSIDNAWDTQRRRGIDPNGETVFPVLPPAP